MRRTRIANKRLGISGRFNRNGNDGTIARFGWKAQNISMLVFSGEACNVEMGITNEAFMVERDETGQCQYAVTPNDVTVVGGGKSVDSLSSIEKFSIFMRFLDAPRPSASVPGGAESIGRGRQTFASVGCAHCHTPQMKTGNASVAALRYQPVCLPQSWRPLILRTHRGACDGSPLRQATGAVVSTFTTLPGSSSAAERGAHPGRRRLR